MHNNCHACCGNHLMGFGFRRSWWPSKYAVAGCGLLVQTRIEEAPKVHQDARSLALAPACPYKTPHTSSRSATDRALHSEGSDISGPP